MTEKMSSEEFTARKQTGISAKSYVSSFIICHFTLDPFQTYWYLKWGTLPPAHFFFICVRKLWIDDVENVKKKERIDKI